jgi:hypothetical protein
MKEIPKPPDKRQTSCTRKGVNKYHAVKAFGHDSTKEHKRALCLRTMQRAGLIRDLQEQVKFELAPAVKDERGKVILRECSYIADFVYYDCKRRRRVVEDCKGFKTKEYILKKKWMYYRYGVLIEET